MNNLNLSDDKINALLQMAGKKLGQDPASLKQQLESGQLDGVMEKLDPKAKDQVNALLQNPKGLEALLSNDKVKNMLSGLMRGNTQK